MNSPFPCRRCFGSFNVQACYWTRVRLIARVMRTQEGKRISLKGHYNICRSNISSHAVDAWWLYEMMIAVYVNWMHYASHRVSWMSCLTKSSSSLFYELFLDYSNDSVKICATTNHFDNKVQCIRRVLRKHIWSAILSKPGVQWRAVTRKCKDNTIW